MQILSWSNSKLQYSNGDRTWNECDQCGLPGYTIDEHEETQKDQTWKLNGLNLIIIYFQFLFQDW